MSANDEYMLDKGSHPTSDAGRCAMGWVAYLAGEPHSDQPVCVSPLLRQFCITLNDTLPGHQWQEMRPYVARTIGTAGDGRDQERSMLAVDWLIRVYTPAWLDLVPSLADDAAALRALPPVLHVDSLEHAMSVIAPAKHLAEAAWDAAGDDAAGAAAAGAFAAGAAAAGAAAEGAAEGAAAWDAAAWAAAAWDAAAWDAARAAAAWDDAAWDAAWDALQPTVERLQHSAVHDLLGSMVPGET